MHTSLFAYPSIKVSHRATLTIALACSLLATGCGHTTHLAAQPDLPTILTVPEHWKTSSEPTPNPRDISRWWQYFGDEQMTALIEQALTASPSVLTAQAALRQARAQRDIQFAGLLPRINAGSNAQRSRQGNNDASNRYGLSFDASWEPDWWSQQSNALQAGDANVRAAIASLQGAHVALAGEVAQTYVELRSLQNRLHIARSNLELQTQTQQITQWRVQAGLAASLEAEQARQSTAQTAAQIPALESSLAQTRHALSILTGQAPASLDTLLHAAAPLPQPPSTLALALPADTLRQRPDVRAQQQRIEAALANLSAQEVANYPSLRLSGSLGVSALTIGALSSGASVAASIAAALSAPLFDGGANHAQIRAQQAAVEQARVTYFSTVLTALKEVEDALVQLQGDQARLTQLLVAQEAASNASLLAQQRYSSGLVDFQTVLDTQRTLLNSQDSVATVQAAISTDHIRLYKALGGGWQPLDDTPQPPRAITTPPVALNDTKE